MFVDNFRNIKGSQFGGDCEQALRVGQTLGPHSSLLQTVHLGSDKGPIILDDLRIESEVFAVKKFHDLGVTVLGLEDLDKQQ